MKKQKIIMTEEEYLNIIEECKENFANFGETFKEIIGAEGKIHGLQRFYSSYSQVVAFIIGTEELMSKRKMNGHHRRDIKDNLKLLRQSLALVDLESLAMQHHASKELKKSKDEQAVTAGKKDKHSAPETAEKGKLKKVVYLNEYLGKKAQKAPNEITATKEREGAEVEKGGLSK